MSSPLDEIRKIDLSNIVPYPFIVKFVITFIFRKNERGMFFDGFKKNFNRFFSLKKDPLNEIEDYHITDYDIYNFFKESGYFKDQIRERFHTGSFINMMLGICMALFFLHFDWKIILVFIPLTIVSFLRAYSNMDDNYYIYNLVAREKRKKVSETN